MGAATVLPGKNLDHHSDVELLQYRTLVRRSRGQLQSCQFFYN